jgi:hypothetical protein
MLTAPQLQFSSSPDSMIMLFRELDADEAGYLAQDALYRARQHMPRVTGMTASRLSPISGRRFFGLGFPREAWFMERGTQPFTMRSLAGKVIPMWITDTDGSMRRDNPKARVRRTEDGRTQVLIFRKAAKLGSRKQVTSKYGNPYMAPAAYPGAPGRINRRQPGGTIATGNTGVRWRHPGVRSMQFLNNAIASAAFDAGLLVETIYVVDPGTFSQALNRKVA